MEGRRKRRGVEMVKGGKMIREMRLCRVGMGMGIRRERGRGLGWWVVRKREGNVCGYAKAFIIAAAQERG